jgi:hypothetical protein
VKKVVLILLLCGSLFAGTSSNAVDDLKDEHKNVNETHESHKKEFENIKKILGEILLTQVNTIFELTKEAELIFLAMQAESEGEMMTHSIILKGLIK